MTVYSFASRFKQSWNSLLWEGDQIIELNRELLVFFGIFLGFSRSSVEYIKYIYIGLNQDHA